MVVGAGIWLFAGSPAKHKVTYATATVSKGDISNSVTATGTIEPVTEVEVGTQVSGIVEHIYVDFNSVVKKGQLLAELDRSNLNEQLKTAQATVSNAQSNLTLAQQQYDRIKTLRKR